MKRKSKRYSGNEKVVILKRHFVDKVSVSDLCDEYLINPTMFYRWQKEFFENGAVAFEKGDARRQRAERKRIEELEAKLQVKNEVLSELMEEHVRLKKALGVP